MRKQSSPSIPPAQQATESTTVYHKTKLVADSSPLLLSQGHQQLIPVLLLLVTSILLPRPATLGTGWFLRGFSLLLFGLLLILIYRYFEEQQARLVEELRTKLSADLHDEVGSMLSGIAMQAELLELAIDEEYRTPLNQLALMSRRAMAQMRDTVWALDARKDNWGSLVDRLHDHAAEILEPKHIAFSLQIRGINRSKSLSPNVRQHLYLIGKEAITNAAKHSNGDQFRILLIQRGDLLEMCIQDNGEAVPADQRSASGLGLTNIHMRAKKLGAQLSIQQKNGFGIALSFRTTS